MCRVTNAHSGPIFLTYRAEPAIDAHRGRCLLPGTPEYDFVRRRRHPPPALGHRADPRRPCRLEEAFRGHSTSMWPTATIVPRPRRGSARRLADANPHHTGDEEYNFFLAVLFPHNQLRIMDYNRVVKDLNGRTRRSSFWPRSASASRLPCAASGASGHEGRCTGCTWRERGTSFGTARAAIGSRPG